MLKYTHYVLENFDPRLDAEIIEHTEAKYKCFTLNIWIGYNRKYKSEYSNGIQIIFSKNFDDLDELKETMNAFGHGFEYMGVKWIEI